MVDREAKDAGRTSHEVKERILQKLDEGDLLAIEALLNMIPYAGGFLSIYFGQVRNRRIAERMNSYFRYFSQQLEKLEEQKLDKEYLNTEEFAELFVQGAEQASRSTTEHRIRRFANILINNALLGAEARSRTQSIMSFVDRISDLDAFVLLCYGAPDRPCLRAQSKDEAFALVFKLASYLSVDCPPRESVIESIVYMDNLGLTWVNETVSSADSEKGKDLILKEFSSFRTPLGDAVAKVIAPPDFYKQISSMREEGVGVWPKNHVNKIYDD